MLRSGQPLCGTAQNRCSEDIQLLNSFLANRSRGKVLDMRSPLLLQQHQNKGLYDWGLWVHCMDFSTLIEQSVGLRFLTLKFYCFKLCTVVSIFQMCGRWRYRATDALPTVETDECRCSSSKQLVTVTAETY